MTYRRDDNFNKMNNQIGKGSRDRVNNLMLFRKNYDEIFGKRQEHACPECNQAFVEFENDVCDNCYGKLVRINKELYDKEKR